MGFFGGGGAAPANMVGATSSTAGVAGLVPAPAAGKNTRALFTDASFGEVPLFPKFKNTDASRWYSVYSPALNGGSAGLTAKVRAFYIIYVPDDGQIDTLGYRVATAPTVTQFNLHVALWEVNEDGTVGSYVIGGTGASGLASNTIISISVSSTSVKRGFYYISATSDINTAPATITFSAANSTGYMFAFLGGANFVSQSGQHILFNYTATAYDQTTHETIQRTIASNVSGFGSQLPSLGFQYV
jgi:hypothetical protein